MIKKSMVDSDHSNFWFIFLTIIRTCGNKVCAGDSVSALYVQLCTHT